MRPINEIIIHCTATRPDWDKDQTPQEKLASIRSWHLDRGWSDIGYHFVIFRDGTVLTGRPIEKVGAHVKGHNTGTIGVSLEGGFGSATTDSFSDHFTEEQEKALRDLLKDLQNKYSVDKITGHNQYAAKACPGFDVPTWLNKKEPSKPREKVTQSKTVQASAVTIASGAGAAVSAIGVLDDVSQYIILGFAGIIILAGMFIMKERIKAWAKGWR
jgi:hypothetical protein